MRYLTDVILVLLRFSERDSRDGWFHGITRMEKIIFLLQQERDLDRWIKDDKPAFTAYKLGPYSQEIYTAVEFLNTYNLIEDTTFVGESRLDVLEETIALDAEHLQYSERRFRLTSRGRKAADILMERSDESIVGDMRDYYREFGGIPLPRLLRYVYRKYPQFTGESIIKESVLGSSF